MLLTHRKLLQAKAIAVENDLRATLRNFGLKVGMVGTIKFEARVKDLVDNFPDLATLVQPLLVVRRVLREQISILHRRVLAVVRDDEVCRRLMTVTGVGPVVALTYRATVDVPARFRKSKSQVMLLRSAKWSWLRAWAMKIARHRGMKKAIVALARRLAVIMHRIWTDGYRVQMDQRSCSMRPLRIQLDRRKLELP
jgi:transposase